ncbi:zinc ABC transporter, periplasmic-binding protein ZnuA [Hydrogenimonas sp.]|nr:zinc ABC transporter, periplasmic-binding protein ZnuA [Hydrogenimonas sp.]
MRKRVITLLLAFTALHASDITIEKAELKKFGKQIHVNAKIVQLSNQKQLIVSRLGGHLERYYVEPGAKVKKGDKIALIKSLELSKMSAEYLALGKKLEAAKARLSSTESLYKKGLASEQDLNREQIAFASIEADRNAIASQLASLGIDLHSLKKPTDTLTIKAHADGLVNRLLVPLHTNLTAETPIISLVQSSGYYAIAYIGVAEALKMPKKVEGRLKIDGIGFDCRYLYLLPKVDEETQRAQMLFWIESEKKPLLLNAFAEMEIDLPPFDEYVAVKRSALTMFEGEWVVFTPRHTEEGEEHEAHEEHGHEEHGHEEHGHEEHGHEEHGHEEHGHEEHGHEEHGHEEHGHEEHGDDEHGDDEHGDDEHGDETEHAEHAEHSEEKPYEVRVVEPISSFGGYTAVRGIRPGEEYVADGVYFVKSLMLKSELGGHGH